MQAWRAGATAERTWRRGLDRALAGVFYSDDPVRVVAGTAPLDGVEGQDATPVGLLAAIVDRIVAIREMLADAAAGVAVGPGHLRRRAAAGRDPAGTTSGSSANSNGSSPRPSPTPPTAAPTRCSAWPRPARAVAGWTESRPSPLHFRTGDVTVCTLVPMRSVPYRVVCLLGMDDDRFPRSSRTDGDDLLLGDEIVGDFDRSAEDRQLLLDAVMAAGDHLIVTYSGRDELTNADAAAGGPHRRAARHRSRPWSATTASSAIETIHPLQSFSEANFTPGALDVPGPFGFDPVALAGARAVAAASATPQPATSRRGPSRSRSTRSTSTT